MKTIVPDLTHADTSTVGKKFRPSREIIDLVRASQPTKSSGGGTSNKQRKQLWSLEITLVSKGRFDGRFNQAIPYIEINNPNKGIFFAIKVKEAFAEDRPQHTPQNYPCGGYIVKMNSNGFGMPLTEEGSIPRQPKGDASITICMTEMEFNTTYQLYERGGK